MISISKVLLAVSNHEEPGCYWRWDFGLCENIFRNFGREMEQRAKQLMRECEDYSGNRVYHIGYEPDQFHGRDITYYLDYENATPANLAQIAYHLHEGDLYTGCYGRRRRDMAAYLSVMFILEGC